MVVEDGRGDKTEAILVPASSQPGTRLEPLSEQAFSQPMKSFRVQVSSSDIEREERVTVPWSAQ